MFPCVPALSPHTLSPSHTRYPPHTHTIPRSLPNLPPPSHPPTLPPTLLPLTLAYSSCLAAAMSALAPLPYASSSSASLLTSEAVMGVRLAPSRLSRPWAKAAAEVWRGGVGGGRGEGRREGEGCQYQPKLEQRGWGGRGREGGVAGVSWQVMVLVAAAATHAYQLTPNP